MGTGIIFAINVLFFLGITLYFAILVRFHGHPLNENMKLN